MKTFRFYKEIIVRAKTQREAIERFNDEDYIDEEIRMEEIK